MKAAMELEPIINQAWDDRATLSPASAPRPVRDAVEATIEGLDSGDLRVAEISQLDMQLKDGKVESYRAKIKVSFKYEGE